jgi:hypothetical protein
LGISDLGKSQENLVTPRSHVTSRHIIEIHRIISIHIPSSSSSNMEAAAWQHMVTLFKHSKYAEELLVLGLWNWQSVCMLVMLCQAESFVETIP